MFLYFRKVVLVGVVGSSRCSWCFKYPGFISVNIKMASNGRCGNLLMYLFTPPTLNWWQHFNFTIHFTSIYCNVLFIKEVDIFQ